MGKKYRIACRRWQRAVKAWERNGGLTSTRIYIPRATIQVPAMDPGSKWYKSDYEVKA